MRRTISILLCCLTVLFTCLILYGQAEAAGRGKALSSALLPRELKNISVKDNFIPSTGKEAGVIRTVVGHVVVAQENMRQAYFAAAGDKLYEKDVLFTLKKSRCRFKLHNEDTVALGENARVGITTSSYDQKTQIKRSAFDMARGKVMFFTMRLFKHKGASMTVSTPTAVAGVRGTKFGVEAIESETNVFTFEGIVDVTSVATGQTTKLGAGQGINAGGAGLGNPFPMTPDVYREFQADTEGTTPGDNRGALGGADGVSGTDPGIWTPGIVDTSKIVQDQGTKDIKPLPTPPHVPTHVPIPTHEPIPAPIPPGPPPGTLY